MLWKTVYTKTNLFVVNAVTCYLCVCVCVCVCTFVARAAHTHQLVTQQVTAVGKLPSTARPIGTHAGATVVTWTQLWVAMVTVQTPVGSWETPTSFDCNLRSIEIELHAWNPTDVQPHLSQWCPVVKSLQPWHSPVWGWQYSLWPLQLHGLHWGKPQKPGRQWEHWRPVAPETHSHWPVASWHMAVTEPRRSHSQAEGQNVTHYTSFFWVYYQLVGLRPLLTSAAGGAEEEGSRSTVVTVPPHDVGSAPTLTSTGVTQGAEGTLRVTLACWEKSRDLINSPHPVSL